MELKHQYNFHSKTNSSVIVLDIKNMLIENGRNNKLYFTVKKEMYDKVHSFCLSSENLRFSEVLSYTERVGKQWALSIYNKNALAFNVYLSVKLLTKKKRKQINNENIAMLMQHFIFKTLVQEIESKGFTAVCKINKSPRALTPNVINCPVCNALEGRLGSQQLICQHRNSTNIVLQMKTEQITKLHEELTEEIPDEPDGLRITKRRCAKSMPKCGFTRSVRLYLLEAGPGCGKSFIIRQLARKGIKSTKGKLIFPSGDLVLLPFKKLETDYEEYNCITFHKAMSTFGNRRIFVDEFTSVGYEYLACIAEVNKAEEIYLVGDRKQTKVLEPTEGLYIGNHIDLNKVSTHVLRVNFRNPRDTVALLNKVFDYEMIPYKKEVKSVSCYSVKGKDRLPCDDHVEMSFSKASARLHIQSERDTVRASQGGTFENVLLYCTVSDGRLPSVEELLIVGMSRHSKNLYVLLEDCPQTRKLFKDLVNIIIQKKYHEIDELLSFPYIHVLYCLYHDPSACDFLDNFVNLKNNLKGFKFESSTKPAVAQPLIVKKPAVAQPLIIKKPAVAQPLTIKKPAVAHLSRPSYSYTYYGSPSPLSYNSFFSRCNIL